MPLFLILLTIPLIEIALFVAIGGEIGLWPTLGVVFGTAILGTLAIRTQGKAVMREMKRIDNLAGMSMAFLNGSLIVVAGLLLLTPGFLTDTIGLLFLVPPVRSVIVSRAAKSVKFAAMRATSAHMGGAGHHASTQDAGDESHDQDRSSDAPRMPVGKPMPDADDAVVLDGRKDDQP